MLRRTSNGTYLIGSRELANGDEIELRLGGNRGWTLVTVTGLPEVLRVVFEADDGARIVTSLPPDTAARWPE